MPGICSAILFSSRSSWLLRQRGRADRGGHGEQREERQEAGEGHRGGQPRPVHPGGGEGAPGVRAHGRATSGPIQGSRVNQSMSPGYPPAAVRTPTAAARPPGRSRARKTSVRVPQKRTAVASAMPTPAPETMSARGEVQPST